MRSAQLVQNYQSNLSKESNSSNVLKLETYEFTLSKSSFAS